MASNFRGVFRGNRNGWWSGRGIGRGRFEMGRGSRGAPYSRQDGSDSNYQQPTVLSSDYDRRPETRHAEVPYNTRMPTLMSVPMGQLPVAYGGRPQKPIKDPLDTWLFRIERAEKNNSIRFNEMVQIQKWPHGTIFYWLLKEVELVLEAQYFQMLKDHINEQKKGPASLFDDIDCHQDDGEPTNLKLEQWLSRAKARAFASQ